MGTAGTESSYMYNNDIFIGSDLPVGCGGGDVCEWMHCYQTSNLCVVNVFDPAFVLYQSPMKRISDHGFTLHNSVSKTKSESRTLLLLSNVPQRTSRRAAQCRTLLLEHQPTRPSPSSTTLYSRSHALGSSSNSPLSLPLPSPVPSPSCPSSHRTDHLLCRFHSQQGSSFYLSLTTRAISISRLD